MSHGWSKLSLFIPLSLKSRNIKHHQIWLPGKSLSTRLLRLPPFPFLLSPPSFFIFPYPSPASHLSLSPSPHPSPPLLRVSGRLFFLCLSLMKGRTKLPSLCPCVVGKITSLFVSFFFFHLYVAASVLHVSLKSASRSGRLWGDLHLHLCILHRTCCNFLYCHR